MSTSLRPNHLRLIDEALERRHGLISLLEAAEQEFAWIGSSSSFRHVTAALKRDVTAEEILNDGVLAAWLPVLMADSKASGIASQYEQLLKMMSQESVRRRSHWQSLAYPFLLLFFVFAILVMMSIWIIPTFSKMFREFELTLPAPTRIVFAISGFINEYPMFLAGAVCVVLGSAWLLTGVFRRSIQFVQLSGVCGRFFAGSTSNVVAMSRFAATLSELLSIGTPIPEALKAAGIASQRVHFRVRSEQLAQEFASSKNPAVRSAVAHNFPSTLLYALSAGTDGGPSIPLLRQLAAIYGDRSRNRSQLSSGFNSSIMVAVIGALVGFVIVALFMPLFSLITALS